MKRQPKCLIALPSIDTEGKTVDPAILRARELRPVKALPSRVEWALAQLNQALATELRRALGSGIRKRGFAAPDKSASDTLEVNALGVLDAYRACVDYDVPINCIADLVKPSTLDIIARRVEDVIWGEVNLYRVLVSLRKVYRIVHQKAVPGPLRHRISYYAEAARRDQWDDLRSPEEYLAGAARVAGLAEIMEASGKTGRAKSLLRDAALMAVGAEVNFRVQEFHKTDISWIVFEHEGSGESASIYVNKEACKNRKGRIGVVDDPRALELLRRFIGDRKDGPLFCTNAGERLSKAGIAEALRRTSLLALGVPLTANLLRRAGASSEDDVGDKARRLGDSSSGSRTSIPVKTYSRSRAPEGLNLLREP